MRRKCICLFLSLIMVATLLAGCGLGSNAKEEAFYKFVNENGKLPDIITCCRFSLHDAAPFLEEESRQFTEGEENVKAFWTNKVKEGGVVLAEPQNYIKVK